MHDDLKLGSRDKIVRKMTREGLVEKNLSRGSEEKISSRAADADLSHVHGESEMKHGVRDATRSAGHEKRYFRERDIAESDGSIGEDADGDSGDRIEAGKSETAFRNHNAEGIEDSSGEDSSSDMAENTFTEQKRKQRKSLSQRSVRSENIHTGRKSEAVSDAKEDSAGLFDGENKERPVKSRRKQQQRKILQHEAAGRKVQNLGGRFSSLTGKAAGEAGNTAEKAAGISETEENNTSEEMVTAAGSAAEEGVRQISQSGTHSRQTKNSGRAANTSDRSTSGKLRFETEETEKNSGTATLGINGKKERQRHARNKRYAASFRSEQKTASRAESAGEKGASVLSKIRKSAEDTVKKHPGGIALLLVVILLVVFLGSVLTVFGTAASGIGSSVVRSTYLASDDEIYAAEAAYSAMEAELQQKINSIESDYPGYEEYHYQVDEISHNPYQLISYLTVKFGDFDASSPEVQEELKALFDAQYNMDVEGGMQTITETKTVRVGQSLGSVVTSGYCNCSICCGKWAGGATASGVYPTANHTIAVDASNPIVPMGTKVIMNGVEYTVEDTGNFAQYGVSFDVYYDDHAAASAHGWQTWDAYLADDNGSQSVEVTTTRTVRALDVKVRNAGFDAVARSRLDSDEALEWYNILNASYGNRDYLWDPDLYAGYTPGGADYTIPPEALSDERFRNMITEAEKYLGYPYVWGGESPATSFDCSGFVSWVINNCGNGWNYGRLTAEGLREICAYVSLDQAKPGDLVFFQGTYDTAGASHVGIYVGNGMMIHCGDPIQYTSIETSYWQEHFLSFGRIP